MKQYVDLFGNIIVEEEPPQVDESELDLFMRHTKEIYKTNGIDFLYRLIRQMRSREMIEMQSDKNIKDFQSIT